MFGVDIEKLLDKNADEFGLQSLHSGDDWLGDG
jgi:hypothetical protein